MVMWLFLAVPWVCLRFVFVVFPDHTHYFCKGLKFRIFPVIVPTNQQWYRNVIELFSKNVVSKFLKNGTVYLGFQCAIS